MTTTEISADAITQNIESYIAAWSESDPARRRQILDQIWTNDSRYSDPLGEAHGPDAFNQHISAFHKQYPGSKFQVVGTPEVHHGVARYRWQMLEADGKVGLDGTEFVDLAADGRFLRNVGFFDSEIDVEAS